MFIMKRVFRKGILCGAIGFFVVSGLQLSAAGDKTPAEVVAENKQSEGHYGLELISAKYEPTGITGARVVKIAPKSPAAQAGLSIDSLIIKVGAEQVTSADLCRDILHRQRGPIIEIIALVRPATGIGPRLEKAFIIQAPTEVPQKNVLSNEDSAKQGEQNTNQSMRIINQVDSDVKEPPVGRPPEPARQAGNLSDPVEEIDHTVPCRMLAVDAVNEIGFRISQVLTDIKEPTNLLISPLGVTLPLVAVASGSNGKTATEFAALLGHDPTATNVVDEIEELIGSLTKNPAAGTTGGEKLSAVPENESLSATSTPDSATASQLSITTSIWIGEGVSVRKSFLDFFDNRNHTYVRRFNENDSKRTSDAINKWIEKRINKKFSGIMTQDAVRDSKLLAISAIFLRSPWQKPFEADLTRQSVFNLLSNEKESVDVPMMDQTETFGYARVSSHKHQALSAQILLLPYADSRLGMAVILPDEGVKLTEVYRALTPCSWRNWLGLVSQELIRVRLPRFDLEAHDHQDLMAPLQKIGLLSAFDDTAADFTGISSERLKIGQVQQRSIISVDEIGTEAAAVNVTRAVASPIRPEPIDFHVNRPFVFAVFDMASGALVFLGSVVNPASTGGHAEIAAESKR